MFTSARVFREIHQVLSSVGRLATSKAASHDTAGDGDLAGLWKMSGMCISVCMYVCVCVFYPIMYMYIECAHAR